VGPWDLALDAAHIQWHRAAGPSVVQNGLALCAIHHKALDRGAIGLAEDGTILVSGTLHGSTGIQEWFLAFKGRRLREPHSPSLLPAAAYFALASAGGVSGARAGVRYWRVNILPARARSSPPPFPIP
jgi:hypothetical protein